MDDFLDDEDLIEVRDEDIEALTKSVHAVPFVSKIQRNAQLEEISSSYVRSIDESVMFCSLLFPGNSFDTFTLSEFAKPDRSFNFGHPLGDLVKGQEISYTTGGYTWRAKVLNILKDEGTIIIDQLWVVPYISLEDYCVDTKSIHIQGVLSDLHSSHAPEDLFRIFKGDFSIKPQEDPSLDIYKSIQGVAGSGKTYSLVQSVLANNDQGSMVVIVCPTNEGLNSNASELITAGKRPIQITNDKTAPYSWHSQFAKNDDFNTFNLLIRRNEKTESEKKQLNFVREKLQQLLYGYVILVTPVMTRLLYRQLSFRKVIVSFYIDEGGLMKMVDLLLVLIFRRSRLWVFGDRMQNVPVVVPDIEQTNVSTLLKDFDVYINTSVSEWFDRLDIPKVFLKKCRRLPDDCADDVVDFYYLGGSEAFKTYVTKNTLAIEPKPYVSFVPPSLLLYPYLNDKEKELEASRLSQLVTYYNKQKLLNKTPDIIVTHNYLKEAFLAIFNHKKKDNKNQGFVPTIYSCYTAQSKTLKYVLFIPARLATSFMDDRLFLVAMTRHKDDFKLVSLCVKKFYPFKLMWYFKAIGVITSWKGSYNKYKKKRRGHQKFKSWLSVEVEWDIKALHDLMENGVYSVLKRLSTYQKGSFDEQLWLLKNKDIQDDIEKFYAGQKIKTNQPSFYKWLKFFEPIKKFSVYRRENNSSQNINIFSEWGKGLVLPIQSSQ